MLLLTVASLKLPTRGPTSLLWNCGFQAAFAVSRHFHQHPSALKQIYGAEGVTNGNKRRKDGDVQLSLLCRSQGCEDHSIGPDVKQLVTTGQANRWSLNVPETSFFSPNVPNPAQGIPRHSEALNKGWDGGFQNGLCQGGDEEKGMKYAGIQRENRQIRDMPRRINPRGLCGCGSAKFSDQDISERPAKAVVMIFSPHWNPAASPPVMCLACELLLLISGDTKGLTERLFPGVVSSKWSLISGFPTASVLLLLGKTGLHRVNESSCYAPKSLATALEAQSLISLKVRNQVETARTDCKTLAPTIPSRT